MEHEKMLVGCKAFIESQFHEGLAKEGTGESFVTISRQAGAGGITVGRLLSAYLRQAKKYAGGGEWEVFDQKLVQKVLNDHQLSSRLEKYMPEDNVSEIDDILEDLLGMHPPNFTLVRKTSGTIARLASLGRVILVGRGANLITQSMPSGFHVRLIGSFAKRVGHVQNYYGFSNKASENFIKKADAGRRNYLKKYFNADIDNPLFYDLTINTDRISYDDAARMIGQAVLKKESSK